MADNRPRCPMCGGRLTRDLEGWYCDACDDDQHVDEGEEHPHVLTQRRI